MRYPEDKLAMRCPEDKHAMRCAEDKHAMRCAEDKHAMRCPEDKHAMRCAEDKHAMRCPEDKHAMRCAEDKHTMRCPEDKHAMRCAEDKHAMRCPEDKHAMRCPEDKLAMLRRTICTALSLILSYQAGWFLYKASPQQGDLKLSGPPSGQSAVGGARTRDKNVPAELWADSLATVPPTPPVIKQTRRFCTCSHYPSYSDKFNSGTDEGKL
ncbi:fam-a protein [Plakobranchus ocellatus]|uniref:Fam-a protein n=1 Tax=Plakobranchus ocellatus TaxID=259542 RepID=A0AAV4C3M3_9GAST|nr:fam-a protein [Plakobranchus ocellatus]